MALLRNTAHLGSKYSLKKITVTYNDKMRILLRVPCFLSATKKFANT